MIPALVINLDTRRDRLAAQAQQLDAAGLTWERLRAVTPATLSPPPDAAYWARWERPMRDVEKAALASHRLAWAQVARTGRPRLILEDDAMLLGGAVDLLARLSGLDGLDHVSLETRGRRKRLGKAHPAAPIRRLWQDRTGAAAYVLWPRGAEKLLARTETAGGLADAVICAAYDMSSWQACPAQAIQFDQCAKWGLGAPVRLRSAISLVEKPDPADFPPAMARGFRRRRVTAQMRMGLRMLAHPRAETIEVVPDLGPG